MDNIFILIFLILFPFGQIIRIGILQPLDVIVFLGAAWSIVRNFKKPPVFKFLNAFLIAAAFSWILSIFIFKRVEVLYGLLYLIRLASYVYFLIYAWHFVKRKKENAAFLINSLLSVSVASAIFGWIQYFTYPSIKPFFIWGWDDHLFRLAGTFLDPGFLGLIIVFGLIIAVIKLIEEKRKIFLPVSIFLLISLAFTYSRASYLALFAGLAVVAYKKRIFKKILIILSALVILMLVLPTASNNVLKFTRVFSAVARIENYSEIVRIFKTSPVFGVGYDNLCLAKSYFSGSFNLQSHACSGSDSSLLFILSTTGLVGFIIFAFALVAIARNLKHDPYFLVLTSSFFALVVHSVFSNSLVYPWIMGWMVVLISLSLTEKNSK